MLENVGLSINGNEAFIVIMQYEIAGLNTQVKNGPFVLYFKYLTKCNTSNV